METPLLELEDIIPIRNLPTHLTPPNTADMDHAEATLLWEQFENEQLIPYWASLADEPVTRKNQLPLRLYGPNYRIYIQATQNLTRHLSKASKDTPTGDRSYELVKHFVDTYTTPPTTVIGLWYVMGKKSYRHMAYMVDSDSYFQHFTDRYPTLHTRTRHLQKLRYHPFWHTTLGTTLTDYDGPGDAVDNFTSTILLRDLVDPNYPHTQKFYQTHDRYLQELNSR